MNSSSEQQTLDNDQHNSDRSQPVRRLYGHLQGHRLGDSTVVTNDGIFRLHQKMCQSLFAAWRQVASCVLSQGCNGSAQRAPLCDGLWQLNQGKRWTLDSLAELQALAP